jgi:hypothetical protein
MKAKLEFNLPDDQADFEIATSGSKYYCALWDINEMIFRMYKHEDPPATGKECWEQVREKLVSILQEIEFNK